MSKTPTVSSRFRLEPAMTVSATAPYSHAQLPLILYRLEACRNMEELKQIHASVIKARFLQSTLVLSKIISFCALSPFGNLDYASMVFTQIPNPSQFNYNAIIRGFSHSKNPQAALFLYQKMVQNGFPPDNYTLPFVFKACAQCKALKVGEEVYVHAIKGGFESDVYVNNTLIRLYAVCGKIEAARKVFEKSPERDLVSWTTMISGYAKMGFSREAIKLFLEMKGAGNLMADEVTIVIVLSACAKLGDLDLGRRIRRYIEVNKVTVDVFVGNALVDMYLKCGDFETAFWVFEKMPQRNVVSWNSMISGLAQQGKFKEALLMFRQMQGSRIEPDNVTLVGVLNSCSNLGALELGKWVHVYLDKNSIRADGFVGNALVDMYAKCGSIDQALNVFTNMVHRDVYSYTSMIVGFAMNGKGEGALALFYEMSEVGIKPDEVTLVGVLSACSHVGLVDEGLQHFENMSRLYNLRPQIEHYGCMVDLLGRAGRVEEAEEFIRDMPIQPDAYCWGALLGACKLHNRVQLGERIAKNLLELEPERDGTYVLMSNIYASASRWRDAGRVRKTMKMQKVKKTPGCSLIELDGMVHEFRMGDKSHPKTKEIYMMVDEILCHLKIEGYVAQTSNVLLDVAEEEKEHALCLHSEKLAIAFGLISTKPGTPLRIVKNLRVCGDCHSVSKFISKIFHREIIVRDRNRFHHFREGSCSCMDYW